MEKKRRNHRLKADGIDVEFSQELADKDDLEAQERSLEAKQRVKAKQSKLK